jgi:hypothetical protein
LFINNLRNPTVFRTGALMLFGGREIKPMSLAAIAQTQRAAINRANARRSTGPRTESGKQRSSLNAVKHGLTAQTAVLPSEDLAAFNRHVQQFLDEHRPAAATETQLVHELANIAWRQNRVPLLEASLFDAASPQQLVQSVCALGIHSQRPARQFQKTLEQLRVLLTERREREQKELKAAAGILEYRKHKGIEWDTAEDGFVFSKDQVERHARRLINLGESRHVAHFRFDAANPKLFTWAT